MPEDRRMPTEDDQRQEYGLLDGVLCNGVDAAAERRAHMREITMARQEAERRHARPASNLGLDRPAKLRAARERTVELHAELARIDAEHRAWLLARGERVAEPPTRRGTPSGIKHE